MFQESLVESTSLLRGRSRWPAVISFALQAAIATTLIVFPMLHPEMMRLRAPRISLTAPRLKPPVVPEPRLRVETSSSSSQVSAPSSVARLSTEGFECVWKRIVRTLQGGIHLDDACPKFLRVGPEVLVVIFHGELLWRQQ